MRCTVLAYRGWRTRSTTDDDDGLVHGVGRDEALADLAPVRAAGFGARLLGHHALSWATAVRGLGGLGRLDLALAQDRVDAGHVLAEVAEAGGVVELPGDVLEAQVEQLLLGLGQPRAPARRRRGCVELGCSSPSDLHLFLLLAAAHELGLDRQLLDGALHGAPWPAPRCTPAELEHDAARLHDGDPAARGCPCPSPCGSRPASG